MVNHLPAAGEEVDTYLCVVGLTRTPLRCTYVTLRLLVLVQVLQHASIRRHAYRHTTACYSYARPSV